MMETNENLLEAMRIRTLIAMQKNKSRISFARLTSGPQWKGWHYYMYQHGLRKYGMEISKLFLS